MYSIYDETKVVVQYYSDSEIQGIIAEKEALGLHLVQVSNITEGNFLIFDNAPNPRPVQPGELEKLQDDLDIMYAQFLASQGVEVNV